MFLRFFATNFALVLFIITISLGNFYGNDSFAFDIVIGAALISVPILIIQYALLTKRRNWFYKSFIFYVSMLTFLFIFGVFSSWNVTVGGSEAGSWTARIDGGMRLVILGQLFSGALLWFGIITATNYMARNLFFNEPKE